MMWDSEMCHTGFLLLLFLLFLFVFVFVFVFAITDLTC